MPESPPLVPAHRLPDGRVPLVLSAHTPAVLRREAAALHAYSVEHPELGPEPIAEMLLRTRTVRKHRALVAVDGADEMRAALRAVADDAEHAAVRTAAAAPRTVGLVFPGQGGQRPGMARLYYDASPAYRAEVDRCAELCLRNHGLSPLPYLLDPAHPDTHRTGVVQPALFVHMVGLAAMWRAAGVRPAATIGHSQGEIAAAYVAGVLSLSDAIDVVTARAVLVEQISPAGYSMAVLGADRERCAAMLARHSGWAELSVVNSPHLHGISGQRETVVELVRIATDAGCFAREIRVAYPAHTSIVSQFRERLRDSIGATLTAPAFLPSDVVCIGATLGAPMTPDLAHADYWYLNLRNMVRFDLAIAAAARHGVDTFIEVADHPTLMLAINENLAAYAAGAEHTVLGTSRRDATDLAEFTRNLTHVALADRDFPWAALNRTPTASPSLPLPDFPPTQFAALHLWAEPAPPARDLDESGPQADTVEDRAGSGVERLVEAWEPLRERKLVRPRRMAVVDPFGGCAELGAALRSGAAGYGASVVTDEDAGWDGVDCVAVLVPSLTSRDPADALTELLGTLPELGLLADGADVWLVTVDGERVAAGETPSLAAAALAAGFRGLGAEYPALRFRHVDVAAADLADAAGAARSLLAALHTADEAGLAVRARVIHGKRLVAAAAPARQAPNLDHVLILGGTGGVGMAFAEHCADAGATRITLLSRSGESADVAARLASIRDRAAGTIEVFACDVTDPAAVRAVASECDSPVTLIVHAAVAYIGVDSADATPSSIAAAFDAKVGGIERVLREFPRAADCRVLLCSSIAATFTARGQLLYAAANRALDALAWRLRAEGLDCDAVQWGLWQVRGFLDDAALAKVRGAGMVAMRPADAVAAGLRATGNSIVAELDWPMLREVVGHAGLGSLLGTPAAAQAEHPPAAAEPEPAAGGDRAGRIRLELARAMGLPGGDAIDGAVPLVALGLDSLQALDLRKRLKSTLELELPVSAILGGASLDDVIGLLIEDRKIGQGVR